GECLGEDGLAVRVAAPLPHIGQVRLVRLGARRVRRVVLVLPCREAAAGAVPSVGDLRVTGETRLGLVPVRAPEGDAKTGRRLSALRLPHRPRSDPTATD